MLCCTVLYWFSWKLAFVELYYIIKQLQCATVDLAHELLVELETSEQRSNF